MKISKRLGKRFLAVLLVVAIVVPLVVFNGGFDTSAATTTASVNASSLNVRSGPGTNYGVTASVTKGTTVTILSIGSNGWNQVQLPNGKTGYVSASYLTMSSASESTPIDGASTSTGTVINATLLNVRSGPGTNYGVKTGIAGGTQVTVISTSNGWSKIVLSNGIEGYVSSSYLSIKNGTTTTTTTIPAVPTGLAISSITTTGATFKWNAVSGATEYQVNVSGGWVTVTGANTTTHVRTGLKANTSYDYCVRAKNAAGYSAWSAYGYFKTTSTSTPVTTPTPVNVVTTKPGVPTNVKVSISGTTATITWSPVSGATTYKVNLVGDHRTTEATTYTYTGLKSGMTYDYCVKAINSYGESAWSSSGIFKLDDPSYGGTTTPTPSTPAPGNPAGGSFAAATKLNASATSSTSYNGNLTSKTQNDYYVYTVAVTGIHLIKSSANIDVVGELFDSNQSSIVSDNNDKGDSKNFVMGYKFNAGTKFYIRVKGNGSSTGAYTLTVAPPKQPKAVLLYTGSYTDTAKYPEFTTADVNMILGKGSNGLNTKEFIISDGGVGYNHYMENGTKKEIINLSNINAMTTAHTSAVTQIKAEYVKSYNDRFKNAPLSLNGYIDDCISLANKLIQADSEVQIWFTFPGMHFISLAQNYVTPYKTQVFEALKNRMSIKDWNRNVRGFYLGTESAVQWYTNFNKTNSASNISNNFGNSVVAAMKGLSDVVHNAGKEMIWIPYYGYPDTEDDIRVGWIANRTDIFDYVVIQPNTYFADEVYTNKGTLTFGAANMGKVSLSVKGKQVVDRANSNPVGGGRTSKTKIGMEMEIDQYIMYDVPALQAEWSATHEWSLGNGGKYPRSQYSLWKNGGYQSFVNSKKSWYYEYETANNGNKTTVPVVYYAGTKDSLLRANRSGTREVAEVIRNFFNYNLW